MKNEFDGLKGPQLFIKTQEIPDGGCRVRIPSFYMVFTISGLEPEEIEFVNRYTGLEEAEWRSEYRNQTPMTMPKKTHLIYLKCNGQVQQHLRLQLFESIGATVILHKDPAASDYYFKTGLSEDLEAAKEVFPEAYIKDEPNLENERKIGRIESREERYEEDRDDFFKEYCNLD